MRVYLLVFFLLGSFAAFSNEDSVSSVVVSGKVLHLDNETPMSVKIFVYDLSNNERVTSTVSDPATGEYHLVLPYGKHYGIGAHLNNYLPIFEELHLVDLLDVHKVEKNMYVAPLEKGEVLPLTNVHFTESGKQLLPISLMALDELVNVMQRHPNMKIEIQTLQHFGKAGYSRDHALKAAKSLVKWLKKKGIDKERMTYGVIDSPDLHVPSDFQEIFEVELIIKEI